MTITHASSPPLASTIARVRRTLIAVPLIAGGIALATLQLIVPWGERNQLGYEALAPIRDAAWTGIVIDSIAMIALGLGLSLVVCRLAPAKGAVWATVGAVLTSAGCVLFGLGAFGFATLVWHATDPSLVAPAEGAALLEYAVASPQHAMVFQMAGFLAFTIGTLLLCVALLRAGTVTRWLPIAVIVLTVALFVVPPRVDDFVQAAQMLCFAGIGVAYLWFARRAVS